MSVRDRPIYRRVRKRAQAREAPLNGGPAADGAVAVDGNGNGIAGEEAARRALERSRALHSAVLESALDCVVTMDAQGRVLDFNPAAQRTFGYTREEAAGRELAELIIPPPKREAYRRGLTHRAENGEGTMLGRRVETTAMRSDGSELPVELATTRTDIGGETIFMGYLRDLTDRHRTDSALREADERYRSLVERIPTVTYICDYDESVTHRYISPQIEEWTGYPAERWIDDPEQWKRIIHPEDRPRVLKQVVECIRARKPLDCEYRLVRADGGVLHVWERETIVRGEDGEIEYSQGVIVDITPLRATQAALRQSEELHRSTVEALSEGVIVLDGEGRAISCNTSGTRITGLAPDELLGSKPPFVPSFFPDGTPIDAGNDPALSALGQKEPVRSVVLRIARPDGEERWISANYQPLDTGLTAPAGPDQPRSELVCSFADISERRRDEAQISYLAYHDALTGLPNRRKFEDHLGPALARARRNGKGAALLYFDLDHFKVVNDSLGHGAGDELLRQIAGRLSTRVRAGDLLARHGGDEFILLLSDLGVNARATAELVATDLLVLLHPPFEIDGSEFEITASVGISLFPEDGQDAQDLLAHADAALYQTKRAARGALTFYQPGDDDPASRLTFSARLRRALEQDEFELLYQPVVTLADGSLAGLEALVRWRDPDEGLLAPAAFIPLAEETGLIELIDEHVMERAIRQLADWMAEGLEPRVAINLSPRELSRDDLPARLKRLLDAVDVDPTLLTIEITESAAMRSYEDWHVQLKRLTDLGVRLALDDFGADFSSLSRLRELPVDSLKIDRRFLRRVPDDAQASAIISAILRLAEALGMDAVAEGVETADQRQFLMEKGCRLAQGYRLGRPVPPEQVPALLTQGVGAGAG
jgi:diguanylate cyclase (GGDEF)-like protein/PAS domain S-box-containing protein